MKVKKVAKMTILAAAAAALVATLINDQKQKEKNRIENK